jgi:aminoglycoside phosphotransferase (APT) family kinase protein
VVSLPAVTIEDLRREIERALGERTEGPVAVEAVAPLSGGACQDNYEVRLTMAGVARRMVLRSDAVRSLPGSIDRRLEHGVITRAVDAGVQTPAAQYLTADLVRDGAHAYFMDWVDGEAIGRRVVGRPELADARATLAPVLARELVKIHSVVPADAPDLFPRPVVSPAESALASARATMDGMREPHPAMEAAWRWLDARKPQAEEVVLVHGDFRTGNFLVRPDGLGAILDWEFAHWGSPLEDLSWLRMRDWRFGRLDLPIGGFAAEPDFDRTYEAASGRAIDPEALHWWSVMNNLSWAGGCVYQGERYLSGEESDFELVAIARRAAEMEWEALRLIERGHAGSA